MFKVRCYSADVSSREDCFKVIAQIAIDFGQINHLLNVAAYFGSQVIRKRRNFIYHK